MSKQRVQSLEASLADNAHAAAHIEGKLHRNIDEVDADCQRLGTRIKECLEESAQLVEELHIGGIAGAEQQERLVDEIKALGEAVEAEKTQFVEKTAIYDATSSGQRVKLSELV